VRVSEGTRMYYLCTYFDKNYLVLGLALYRSLQRYVELFELNILCMDEYTYKFFTKHRFANVNPISLEEFEGANPRLLEAKTNRSLIEYYYTCTPALPLYLLKKNPAIDVITYLDADLFFYSDLEPIYKEFGSGSILIVPHRFAENMRSNEKYGIYNVGLLSFRNDTVAQECLRVWRDQCLQWCYERPEDGKNADQKYLDDWTTRYKGVVVLQHKGAGLGGWNIDNYQYKSKGKALYVNGDRLIFYHFQGLKMINRFLFQAGYALTLVVLRHVYAPYIREMQHIMKRIEGTTRLPSVRHKSDSFTWGIKRVIKQYFILVLGVFSFEIYLWKYVKPFFALKGILTRR